MEQTKSVAYGFTAAASAICLFVTLGWMTFQLNQPWIALVLLVFLAVPFSFSCILYLKRLAAETTIQTRVKQAKQVLLALQGVGLACWFFDVLSTVFVVDINQTSSELNPLGWPFGALGALAYYVPITFVVYFLLFKVKSKASFYGAAAISAVTLFMAARNLNASFHNFPSAYSFTSPNAQLVIQGIWFAVVALLVTANVVFVAKRKKASGVVSFTKF